MQDILQQLSPILGNPALWLAVTLVAFIFGQHLYSSRSSIRSSRRSSWPS